MDSLNKPHLNLGDLWVAIFLSGFWPQGIFPGLLIPIGINSWGPTAAIIPTPTPTRPRLNNIYFLLFVLKFAIIQLSITYEVTT